MPPAKLGLIYSHTGLRKFIEVCGVANTRRAVLRRPQRRRRARRWRSGLVNQVVEPDELEQRALDLAGEIAANAPLSLAGNKRDHPRAARAPRPRCRRTLEGELIELRESCFRSEDFREGVRAFGEKRRPDWQGR